MIFGAWNSSSEACEMDNKHIQAFLISFSSQCFLLNAPGENILPWEIRKLPYVDVIVGI